MKPAQYRLEVLIAIDRLVNACLRGSADETLSSRAWRMHVKGQRFWGWTSRMIDGLFFWEPNHCQRAYEYESTRWALQVLADEADVPLPAKV